MHFRKMIRKCIKAIFRNANRGHKRQVNLFGLYDKHSILFSIKGVQCTKYLVMFLNLCIIRYLTGTKKKVNCLEVSVVGPAYLQVYLQQDT